MEDIRKQLIVKFVELNLLIDLFGIDDTHIKTKKFEIISLFKDFNILNGSISPETIKSINAIENFNKAECKDLVNKNLKILLWDN